MSTVVQPVLDHAAAERARLVNAARAELLQSAGAVTVEMLAKAISHTPGATRQWLHRKRDAGRIVTVTHDGSVLIPTYQLSDAFGLNEEVAEVTAYLVEHHMSSWAVWDWFASPNTWLDGETPIAALSSGTSTAVQTAAAGLFQE